MPKGSSRRDVWEVRERLPPLPLTTEDGNEFLMIRILFNKVNRKFYLDIRTFTKEVIEKDEQAVESFKITEKGNNFDLDTWASCLPKAAKLIRKYRNE